VLGRPAEFLQIGVTAALIPTEFGGGTTAGAVFTRKAALFHRGGLRQRNPNHSNTNHQQQSNANQALPKEFGMTDRWNENRQKNLRQYTTNEWFAPHVQKTSTGGDEFEVADCGDLPERHAAKAFTR